MPQDSSISHLVLRGMGSAPAQDCLAGSCEEDGGEQGRVAITRWEQPFLWLAEMELEDNTHP